MTYGPKLPISEETHALKYRSKGETFEDAMNRIAAALAENDTHYKLYRDILLNQRFLPAGRIQAAIGAPRITTAYNCFVSGTIEDSMDSIMDKAKEAAQTMRLGGGIGYDFTNLRPRGSRIRSLDSISSGPIGFMDVFDAVCGTVRSAGHRRGAQMGVLRIDHPDIEEFIDAKTNSNKLTNFNISVGVTDKFMEALRTGSRFDLTFEGETYSTVSAAALWDKLMRATWDWAEPGVLFIDTINRKNNLWYAETISATNPCGEQPLPPYGACLLGSFNLTKYVTNTEGNRAFHMEQFHNDIVQVVLAQDNIIDRTIYPLPEQEREAKTKRRMGLGLTGVANALEVLGLPYGSPDFLSFFEVILKNFRDATYMASIALAEQKGSFEKFESESFLNSGFAKSLPEHIRTLIRDKGIRNSHLLSIAPTGTISLCADNISSGIEPVFSHKFDRTIMDFNGQRTEEVTDWAYREHGIKGRTADEVSGREHVDVLNLASKYVDSACSKTCNVGESVGWEEFKSLYVRAYEGGASGCTTFRAAGKRYGILNAKPTSDENEGSACYYDPDTGKKSCE